MICSPHIYRTRDFGKTWTEITKGLADNAPINVVREDPERKGLLFAGSETAVYVSFNDGDDWQPLQLNLPHTSMRDLAIHGDDLIVGTHGRSFWVLDDITPLRQWTPRWTPQPCIFSLPRRAVRFRWNRNTDTPLPPEIPAGQNPPDGAIIDYLAGGSSRDEVKLEIFDAQNRVGAPLRQHRQAQVHGENRRRKSHPHVLGAPAADSFRAKRDSIASSGICITRRRIR